MSIWLLVGYGHIIALTTDHLLPVYCSIDSNLGSATIYGAGHALEFSIDNPETGRQTKVTVNQVQYNRGIPDKCFGGKELER